MSVCASVTAETPDEGVASAAVVPMNMGVSAAAAAIAAAAEVRRLRVMLRRYGAAAAVTCGCGEEVSIFVCSDQRSAESASHSHIPEEKAKTELLLSPVQIGAAGVNR